MPESKTRSGVARDAKTMSAGQRAYEARRAAKAGMGLQQWIDDREQVKASPPKPKAKGKLSAAIGRLLDRAHKPLGRP